MLIDIARPEGLFHTATGTAFADIAAGGHRETWPIRSKRFRGWLRRCYYQATGEAASAAEIRSALDLLEARAQFFDFPVFFPDASDFDGCACVKPWVDGNNSPLLPKLECYWKGIDVEHPPPCGLVARAMQLAVVDPANRDGELVAHSTSECTRLGKGEVMRI
jgi:hypothetical protein